MILCPEMSYDGNTFSNSSASSNKRLDPSSLIKSLDDVREMGNVGTVEIL